MKTLRLAVATLLFVAGGSAAFAFDPMISLGGKHLVVHPDGGNVGILVTSAQTDGAFSVITLWDKPGGGPGPAVTHKKRTETFYVLEGTYTFYQDGKKTEGGPGTIVVNPPGVPHGFVNTGTTDGTILAMYSPGGFEDFFIEWDKLGLKPGPDLGKLENKYDASRPPPQ